jgi:hypothetical protein
MEVTKWLKPSISVSRIGDSASVQAATRVNAKQALYVTRICKVPEGEFDFLGYTFGRMYSARTGQAHQTHGRRQMKG